MQAKCRCEKTLYRSRVSWERIPYKKPNADVGKTYTEVELDGSVFHIRINMMWT